MRSWSIPLLLVVAAAVPLDAAATAPKQYRIRMEIKRGDPRGSQEAGTIKVLVHPNVFTLEKQPATFISGGQILVGDDFIPVGLSVRVAVEALQGDKIQLKLVTQISHVEQGDEGPWLLSTKTAYTRTMRLGESIRVQISKGGGTDQTWAVLTVE